MKTLFVSITTSTTSCLIMWLTDTLTLKAVSMVDRSVAVAVNAVERAAAARADVEEPKEKLPTLQQLPAEVQYLLVGAGTASFAAFRAIKSR